MNHKNTRKADGNVHIELWGFKMTGKGLLTGLIFVLLAVAVLGACSPATTGNGAVPTLIPTAAPLEAPAEEENQGETTQSGAKPSEIAALDETWNQFTNHELGFSIKFPKEMATFRGSCTWNEDEGSYRPQMALVPVKIFEDTDAVYIAAEHFYELAGERQDGGKAYYDECNLVTNSLELLRDPDGFKEPYWQLVAEEIRDDGELDSFIKERYGSGCSLGEQSVSNQDGVYDVKIQGDGKGLEETQCPLNFATVVKYFPAGGKVVAWDRGQSYHFPADVNYTVIHDQEMEDSFRFLTGTSTETAEEPRATVGYSNEETGISFSYPTGWAMEEEDNAFIFRKKGSIILRVGYRMPGQTADLHGRTGMGGTGVNALEGTAQFLGQSLARYGVYYDDLLITVVYGGEPRAILQSGAMEFTIILDDPDTDYQTLTLTDDMLAEAEMILASFEVGSSQGGPIAGLNTYINSEYGFTLNYPSSWTAAEVNGEDFVGPGSRSVQFSQGTVKLIIGYRRAGESIAISGSGAPGGEFEIRGTVHIAGQNVDRYVIVYEGKDKIVMYGQPEPPPLSAGGLEFALSLNDFNPDYDIVELSQAIKDDADLILSSLALIESESRTSDESVEQDTTGWQTYTNDAVGYSLMIPEDAQIMSQDPSQRVAFIGPEVEGKPRFQIIVDHYVPNLPEGADFRESLLEGYRAYLDSLGIDHGGMIEEVTIAGESAIRTRHAGTGEYDPPRDDFVFMHAEMLFQISITHFGGVEDSALNDQFLQSITFGSA